RPRPGDARDLRKGNAERTPRPRGRGRARRACTPRSDPAMDEARLRSADRSHLALTPTNILGPLASASTAEGWWGAFFNGLLVPNHRKTWPPIVDKGDSSQSRSSTAADLDRHLEPASNRDEASKVSCVHRFGEL